MRPRSWRSSRRPDTCVRGFSWLPFLVGDIRGEDRGAATAHRARPRAEQAGWAPEIGTRRAGLRDRPGRTCDHRGDVVVGALGEAAAFRRVREGKGEADEVPSVRTTPSPLKSEGSNGPW